MSARVAPSQALVPHLDRRFDDPGRKFAAGFVWFDPAADPAADGPCDSVMERMAQGMAPDGPHDPECYPDGKPYYGDAVRIKYATGTITDNGVPELSQANWGLAMPYHFQAAANALIEAGILVPHDGKVMVTMCDWDEPKAIPAVAIDHFVRIEWTGTGSNREGKFVY